MTLTPVLPIVFHTGPRPWGSNRTLTELFATVPELTRFMPAGDVVFWDLANHTTAELLGQTRAFLQTLAVVRASTAEAEEYRTVSAETLARIEAISEPEAFRWRELLRFLVALGLRDRPEGERDELFAAAVRGQQAMDHQREVLAMRDGLSPGMSREVYERGILGGMDQGIQIGTERGMDKGIQIGTERGRDEGKAEMARQSARLLLEERFGIVPVEIRARITACNDVAALEAALRATLRIQTPAELPLPPIT